MNRAESRIEQNPMKYRRNETTTRLSTQVSTELKHKSRI